jgi:hypothetical protein
MGFTTPCFIRKNTEALRKKLEEIGYKMLFPIEYDNLECSDNWVNDIKSLNDCNGIDCGTNEELFLAIAALRDDSNYMQWFIADSILSVSYDDSIGNDHYFIEPKGIMFFWDENWDNATIISGRYHKATVNELIEHFKIKEEQ